MARPVTPKSSKRAGGYTLGSARPLAKLDEDAVLIIRKASASGWTGKDLAAAYNVSTALISGIIRGHTWQHVDGPIRADRTEQ